jgi:hypothetical protein
MREWQLTDVLINGPGLTPREFGRFALARPLECLLGASFMSEAKSSPLIGEAFSPISPSRSTSHVDRSFPTQTASGLEIVLVPEPVSAAEISLRRIALAWLLAVIILCAAAVGVACFIPARVDPAVLKQLRKPLTAWARGGVQPAPLERAIYFILTLLSPAAALIGGWWAGLFRISRSARHSADLQRPRFWPNSTAIGLGMSLTVVAVMLTLEFPSQVKVFRPLWRAHHVLPWVIGGGLLMASLASWAPMTRRRGWKPRRFASFSRWAALAAVFALIAARVATVGVFDLHHVAILGGVDWNTVFYSVSQAEAGARPMIDFTAQYGYYSALLKPWFALVGLSVFSFTATMAALQGFSMACIGWVLWLRMRNGPLLVLCMAALGWLMMTWLGIYYAYYPIRLLFPAISVLAVYAYWNRPTASRAAIAGALLGGPGVWWNLDSGVVAIGSWICVLAVKALSETLDLSPAGRRTWRTWRHLAISFGAAAFGFAMIYLALSAEAGRCLDIRLLTRFQLVFYLAGFGKLPMPLSPHLWQVIIGIYLAGLIFGLSSAIRARRLAPGAGTILHLSVLGVGLFSYYQGRSHDYNLVHVSWPAVCLVFLFADRLLAAARARVLPRIFAAGALPAASLGAVCLVSTWTFTPSAAGLYWNWLREGLSRNPPSSSVTDAAEYIARAVSEPNAPDGSRSKRDVSCAILSPFQATYFAALGMRSTLKGPSLLETLLRRDLDAVEDQLRSRDIRHVFIEDRFIAGIGSPLAPLGPDFRVKLLGWYRVVGRNPAGNLLALEPRAELDQDPETTFAREFGERARLTGAAAGRHAVTFAPSGVLLDTVGGCVSFPYAWWTCAFDGDFTLEVVFRPAARQADGACLVSNRAESGSEGFAVLQSGDAPNRFVFKVGDGRSLLESAPFTVSPDEDNYLAVVRRGGKAFVFINGRELAAPAAHFASATAVTFGNSEGAAHPFEGQVVEVQWNPTGLATEELEQTWRRLAPGSR